jgi:selenide,water dikinase
MTDVTGFGLLGHLLGMCDASATGAELMFDAIPTLTGAKELAATGIRSSLFADNAALLPQIQTAGAQDLLFDPQTAGGLLAAVPADQASEVVEKLKSHAPHTAVIGRLSDLPGSIVLS